MTRSVRLIAPPDPTGPEQAVDARRLHILASAKRQHARVAVLHLCMILILSGYSYAGYVSWEVVAGVAVWVTIGMLAFTWAYLTGWSLRFEHPGLTTPQQSLALGYLIALAYCAPQLAVVSIIGLMISSADCYFAPNRVGMLALWLSACASMTFTVMLKGQDMLIPAGNTVGKLCTVAMLMMALARSTSFVLQMRTLQTKARNAHRSLAQALERIEHLATSDVLTGLPNRRAVTDWLVEQRASSDRTGRQYCVCMADIDHFKRVNDRLGHAAGDQVLAEFGRIAPGSLRKADRVGRYGGEEFLIVMPDTVEKDAELTMHRIAELIRQTDWSTIDPALRVTLTIGVACSRVGEDPASVVRRADEALYEGKAAGRDRVVVAA